MRLLLIEDDTNLRESIRISLEAECYAVDTAEDGEEGSYLGRTGDYDLIILDVSLPKKDGCAVCTDIRHYHKHTPIIMLSVISDPQEKVRLLDCGADDYMTKPFLFKELLARMRALLRRPSRLSSDILQIQDLIIDVAKQKVTRNGKDIYLTRKEFSLLEYLMRHQGAVVSRGMIMEHVWNAESDPFSNTIEAHILNVRKKVDMSKRKPLIHTVPGRGYRINV